MSQKNFQIEKFSDPGLVRRLTKKIAQLASSLGEVNLMEVCGTHTMSIARFALKELLPQNVHLLSGPGCPVCVTPNETIDQMIALTKIPDVIITTFGDMMRVPGSSTSLLKQQAEGADIRVVYSPLEALKIAKDNTSKQVVFLGVGFETTTPLPGVAVKKAAKENLDNFTLFCAHKNMPGVLETIVNDSQVNVDALILPGHVSTIIGTQTYEFLAEKYGVPGVVTGFEPVDILQGIEMLLQQLVEEQVGKPVRIEIAYKRGVQTAGNFVAQKMIEEVFETCSAKWRGIGEIPGSGYKIREQFAAYDAVKKFDLSVLTEPTKEHKGCRCGDVLRGVLSPKQCSLFGRVCNPQNPVGPCMVSTEGSCSASYKYQ